MILEHLIEKVMGIIEEEPKLIPLKTEGRAIFVGDTHGDIDASQKIIQKYLKGTDRIIFLGDYVDRGEDSEGNIQYLLEMKLRYPDHIFLLAGNHEGYMVKELSPANFWESLSQEEKEAYGLLFSKFPLAATTQNGVLALHGGLPDLNSLEEMNHVEWGDPNWDRMVWGDFKESEVEFYGNLWGRPQFGRPYFEQMMKRYQKQILIRSHQPNAPQVMFKRRCLTIFTSNAYLPIRTVAVVDLRREIINSDDIILERV